MTANLAELAYDTKDLSKSKTLVKGARRLGKLQYVKEDSGGLATFGV